MKSETNEYAMREANFEGYGYRELRMASELINAYLESPSEIELEQVKVGFNPQSGSVFLYDEEYRTYMMNGEKLEEWFNCPECDHEGFKEDFAGQECEQCKEIEAQ